MPNKGFTLIELLVVVAIIGILSAVGVVAYNGYTTAAKKRVVLANLDIIKKYITAEMMKCSVGIEMEAYQLNLPGATSCSYVYSVGTEQAFRQAFNVLSNKTFKNIKSPFDSSQDMLHARWNKSGQGMPKITEAGRIHCNWDAADAKGTWENFIKNNIGGCDARYGTDVNDTVTIYFYTIEDYDYHRGNWQ